METLISGIEVDSTRSLLPINLTQDYVLIDYLSPERTVEDGVAAKKIEGSKLLAAGNAVEQYSKGVIKAFGNNVKDVKLGSTMYYFRQQAKDKEFEVDGKLYDLINAVDLIGTI